MLTDPYTHMEEAFGLDVNPFPAEAISSGAETECYSDLVFPEETHEFRLKMIRGGLQGGRKTGFLWSMSPTGEDTGFGKTTLMRNTARAINGDFGAAVQENLGIKPERIKPIVAAFAELNEQEPQRPLPGTVRRYPESRRRSRRGHAEPSASSCWPRPATTRTGCGT